MESFFLKGDEMFEAQVTPMCGVVSLAKLRHGGSRTVSVYSVCQQSIHTNADTRRKPRPASERELGWMQGHSTEDRVS